MYVLINDKMITELDIGRLAYADCTTYRCRCWVSPVFEEGKNVNNLLDDNEPILVLGVPQYFETHRDYMSGFEKSTYRMMKVLTRFGVRYVYPTSLRFH